jgi:two-component system, cell cycle sensor histidine kinase and response regulator CckA
MSNSPDRTVLVVNDDSDHAQFLSFLLQESGFVPTVAVDGVDGLEKARRCGPDVIVCDVNMPRMDGFDLCRAVRADEHLREIPVLLVTALSKGSDIMVEGLVAGADDLVELPYDPVRIVAKVTRLAERRLVESESKRRLRALYVALADLVIVLDRDGLVHNVEATRSRVLYRPSSEMIGRTLHEVMPEHAERFVPEIHRALECGQPHDVEYWLDIEGATKWFEATISPLSDHTVFWVARDVKERKALRDKLEQAQKMEAVGRLAGGIAHDFNNILTAIVGFGDLAANALPLTSPLRSDVEEVLKAATRASTLTRQLLTFSRKQMLRPEIVDVNGVVANLEPMLRRLLHEDIELRTELGMGLGYVRVDRNQLEQVLLNLAINAKDAMPAGGLLTIRTSRDEVTGASHERREDRQGEYVVLEVSDTGVGMDARMQAHLFEPFFTTKEPGKGTGLGLATVHGIVEQSGGFVSVHSEPNHGTSFTVFLPLLSEAPFVTVLEDSQVTGGKETVLVVEDDAAIRTLAQTVLTKWGYRVLVASNGVDALQVAAQDGRPIDLLLTDVVMPNRGGRVLADDIRRQHTNVRVLYMSGYPDDTIAHQGVLDPPRPFLPKPFTPDALLIAVRSALNSGGC